ncbi:MAG: nickel-binding protein [Actinomycetes bacterium]
MPRFLVERTFSVGEQQMQEVGTDSKAIAKDKFPDITWEHSHVIVDGDGVVRTFCLYGATDEEMVREHAQLLGRHTINNIWEVAGDVTPADFPG